ncbi:MerR family transcriptional regulator [Ornithinimicrobium sp. F0845]|uniref:MerR family transcriptional regulator n=1 Tax=Ornithinimicrobium sp. F0845 TaxID=2926412 RepID=UPI001FF4CA9D|nr:MerR family transcriptional regulator [Ornithinimicrobium sp. F0845]
MTAPDPSKGVYAISVAADLVGMGMQQLRWYEAQGLLAPERTSGGTRRYSENDLTRLRRIDQLLDSGLNLAGIAMVMDLQDEVHDLRHELTEQQATTAELTQPQSTTAGQGTTEEQSTTAEEGRGA